MSESIFEKMVTSLASLPGIGRKSATRISFHLLRMDPIFFEQFIENIRTSKLNLKFCSTCAGITEQHICEICESTKRDSHILCVIEQPEDIFFIEKTGVFSGKYHVLNGAISPLDGIGPEQLRIRELEQRIQDSEIQEVLLATNPTLEGDATASYVSNRLQKFNIRITRIAHGLTVGGTIEYSDQYTLSKAINARLPFQ
ncbi:recombination mediator RecR [Leptospira sp. GIMC2001]|uniref:recombination mediator RecR n=1 Tax=Leptospira sp. GIMC2001 TaxID=1513297 RepID=UPI003FA52DE6